MRRFVILLLFAAALFGGCASCPTCFGQTPPAPSPQAPAPRNGFATPPTDDRAPDPNQPPVARPTGTGRIKTTTEAEGAAAVITGNSGPIYFHSPGVSAPAQAHAVMPVSAGFPIVPGPLPDAAVFSLTRRVLGAGYYLLSGKCPAKPAGFAVPASYAMVPVGAPVQQYAAVPVAAQAPAVQPVVYQYVQPDPRQGPPIPQQFPEAMATPQAPAKAGHKWFRR